MKHDTVTPYESEASKKEQVAEMFDNIAAKYDFLNHFLSAGIDKRWRKKAIKELAELEPKQILDVATGTGDFAFEAMKLNPDKLTGIDISEGMLKVGREKIKARSMESKMEFLHGDSEALPFDDNTFDAVTVSFGARNFQNLKKGLSEIYRVLKPEGKLVVLEFSKPRKFPLKQLYFFYFKAILPVIGKVVSKDNSAYTYLPDSVMAFPEGKAFNEIMGSLGYTEVKDRALTGGIASIYTGRK